MAAFREHVIFSSLLGAGYGAVASFVFGFTPVQGSLAACMLAMVALRHQHLRGDVILTAVCDEEYASLGTQAIVKTLGRRPAQAAIVTEPTEMRLPVPALYKKCT